ncbi:MAG: putative quinol monooxygenase, partial [Cardiobacterium sp.]
MKKTALLATTASAPAAPVFNIFELGIKDGQSAAYDQIGDENIRTSLAKEPGTLAIYSVKQKTNPQMAYMIEIYADDAAYQTHIQSPQYRKFREVSPQILTDHKHKYNIEPQYLGDKKVEQNKNTRTNFVSVTVKPE